MLKDREKPEGQRTAEGEQQPQTGEPRRIEWIIGGMSALITVAMIAFLLYQAFSMDTGIPQIEAAVDRIRAVDEAFHVEFHVTNRGDATAAAVLVQGRLMDGPETIEEREVTFDYVPAHSQQKGALIFDADPRKLRLRLEPHGYKEP